MILAATLGVMLLALLAFLVRNRVLGIILLGGCAATAGCTAPRLQVVLWRDATGTRAATIRCSAGAQTATAEIASESTLTARPPTEAQ